jgi:hypothetical protein
MEGGLSAACQTNVRSRKSSGKRLLDDAVLGARRVGRVERCAEGVTVGLSEANPALVQPGLPLLLRQALHFGVGERERLQLFPSERLDLRLRLGDPWQRRRLLRLGGAAESFAEQQLDRGNPGPDVGDGNLDALAVATVGASDEGQVTTVDVRSTVTSPAFQACRSCSNERTRRGCTPLFQVTSTTAQSGRIALTGDAVGERPDGEDLVSPALAVPARA